MCANYSPDLLNFFQDSVLRIRVCKGVSGIATHGGSGVCKWGVVREIISRRFCAISVGCYKVATICEADIL